MAVTDAMFAAIDRVFGRPAHASVQEEGAEFVVGYREGRDVCVVARGPTWEEALRRATDRVALVDHLVRDTPSNNVAVATAASVPVRFVRIRRRDLGVA